MIDVGLSVVTRQQAKAVLFRYLLTLMRFPIRTLSRMIIKPIALWSLAIYIGQSSSNSDSEIVSAPMVGLMPIFTIFLTIFHMYHHMLCLVDDKATGFRGLMFAMGLKRDTYYIVNCLIFVIYISLMTIPLGIVAKEYILVKTQASWLEVMTIFALLGVQLTGFVFAIASTTSSTTFVGFIILLTFISDIFHSVMSRSLRQVNEPLRPVILFLSGAIPYEPLRIFLDSYTVCGNCDETKAAEQTFQFSQPTYLIIISMFFWSVISFTFARWFDEVCPWQTETETKDPFFCLKSKKEAPQQPIHLSTDPTASKKFFEESPRDQHAGIRLFGLTKIFNKIPVVNNVSFNIYKGETTLLLGHNGAGKTTLMNLILGKLSPSSGSVSIQHSEDQTRSGQFVGLCPQTSVIDYNLSVKQHVQLFAAIKGSHKGTIVSDQQIDETLQEVSLKEHAGKFPDQLSGGMKRKLSLAMAFIGDSDVLILDEPSSGLDPDSRVFIWNAIRKYRANRTVLLSTQHMEEADYLGDRVAIMKAGQMICCGSTTFLNKAFGLGYRLRVECQHAHREQVLTFVKSFFPDARITETAAKERSVQSLSDDTVINMVLDLRKQAHNTDEDLIHLLRKLENEPNSNHIISYGLRCSSIEDVMLKTGKETGPLDDLDSVRVEVQSSVSEERILTTKTHLDHTKLLSSQLNLLSALIIKHLHTFRRNWLSTVCYRLLVPVIGIHMLIQSFARAPLSPGSSGGMMNSFLILHLIYHPGKEQVSKFKTMQLTSSANLVIYWLSQLLIDSLCIAYLVGCVNVMLSLTFSGTYLKPELEVRLLISFAMVLFVLSAALLAYVISTLIGPSSNPMNTFSFLFIGCFIVVIVVDILTLAVSAFPDWISKFLRYLFIIVLPTDALQHFAEGLVQDGYIRALPKIMDTVNINKAYSPISIGLYAMFGQIVGYSIILALIEFKLLDLTWYLRWQNLPFIGKSTTVNYTRCEIDSENVILESQKAQQAINQPSSVFSLVAANLSKSYIKNTKVVDELSLTVSPGECFGLLGVNGSGKTTTFSMIAAELKPDAGVICLNGHFSNESTSRYRQELSYDPQATPELYLTPSEALYLMARLRCVEEQYIPELVEAILSALDMVEHRNKPAQKLSGGTQRKLALGMSLIGCPEFLVLDEPTAGVDPLARRGIWALLKSMQTSGNASIIIASHAMEECEAICDRITIMAHGRLICIGTFLQLSKRYSRGYRVKVQASDQMESFARILQQLHSNLKTKFSDSILLSDKSVSSATFIVSDKQVKRSELLEELYLFKKTVHPINYSVNDSSLEDIFLYLARKEQESRTRTLTPVPTQV